MTQIEQVLLNIVGGILASMIFFGFFELIRKLKIRLLKKSFKIVFGNDATNDFSIVYGKMILLPCFDKDGKPVEWPYAKPDTNSRFRFSSPISFTSTKSAKYISESFVKNGDYAPKLVSDEDIRDRLDISYCALGGLNNYKTIDILESEENSFYEFRDGAIIDKEDQNKKYVIGDSYDYAIVIKAVPKLFPDRVWMAVAGLGEWGTSGASWFLSKKWEKIKKIAGDRAFGLVVRVKGLKDESAEILTYKVKK
jgi:hypothetical protein